MATVTGLTAAKTLELLGKTIVSGGVDGFGHLILEAADGSTVDAGDVTPPPLTLEILPRDVALGPSYYPEGVSYFPLSPTNGYPAQTSTVQTTRESDGRAFQMCVAKTTGRIYIRAAGDSDTWGAFTEIVGVATTVETQAGTIDNKAVTPAGLASVVGIGAGYRFVQKVIFTSSGSFLKASYPGVRAIRVMVVGGGGSGGGAGAASAGQNSQGSGGGAGGYAESWITDIAGLASSVAVTVGAGGAGRVGLGDGLDGSASSFGALVAANGGTGGYSKGTSALGGYLPAGPGGSGTAGDIQLAGNGGGSGFGQGTLASGGHGGGSIFGGGGEAGGTGAGSGGSIGRGGRAWGAGGAGASANASSVQRPSNAGADGVVIVEIYR